MIRNFENESRVMKISYFYEGKNKICFGIFLFFGIETLILCNFLIFFMTGDV